MGRPEPCVLFSHSFVHVDLDEYVDEVLFAGPVVITGCEFIEQNASPSVPAVSLVGATSPPSFALEVFVHCEGESRFRRLCQAFLYSPSSSNVLEVEAVVTNHLVVRGTYCSLSLVIYGNTAEDLGQFNIDVDMDSSLANLVFSASEGKIEDLPLPLRSMKLSLEDSISSLRSLSPSVLPSDLSTELKGFLLLVLKISQIPDLADALSKVLSTVVSSFISGEFGLQNIVEARKWIKDMQYPSDLISDARDELEKLCNNDQLSFEDEREKLLENGEPRTKVVSINSEWLVKKFGQCFPLEKCTTHGRLLLTQNKNLVIWLGVAFLLCSAKESCFWFVTSGAMKKLNKIMSSEFRSPGSTLLLLCVVEQATRHAIGCEAFLGWWPRKDSEVPAGISDGYCRLLSLLIQKQRHDVASLASYILHRLRFYEVAVRYESQVLSFLTLQSADRMSSLCDADVMLKSILKLINLRVEVEDPSPAALSKSSSLAQQDLLSYKATVDFISGSKRCFSTRDIDGHLLSLLKERGFLPLSAAILSSPTLRMNSGVTLEIFIELAASIEEILLRLLNCRSGLLFLLCQPEATAALVLSLQGMEESEKADYVTLRHAAVLMSKGFFCRPEEIGMIAEVHLRVAGTIDMLLSSPHSEEQLWTLWELCAISRSDAGRQALLSAGQFPEAVSALIQILRSFKDMEPVSVNAGSLSSSIAVFHFAAEIVEAIVMDSNATSLSAWIRHAVDLHGALHASSPGLNKKNAPSRVLDWIDAGVVYHKSGPVGLLRYAAVLASGGDAHLSSSSVLVSESMDVENVVGESGPSSDFHFVENLLGKFVADKLFEGIALPNMSLVQLTTAFRILAFVSENSTVAAMLFEEGAVTLIFVVLMNSRFILERSSNTFDYLVDEGGDCGSTSDLLLEQNIEQSVVELMIPALVLLINLLRQLHEAKEQYRNTKLLKALLRLHRELSPKLAACEAEFSFHYRSSALRLCTLCRLLASAMACWPIFGWAPGLFHCVLDNIQASLALALGPKDACSLFFLLGDLLPEEGLWLWKNGIPLLSAIRTLGVGTILGHDGEKFVEWHLQSECLSILLGRLAPQLNKIAQIVLHFGSAGLVVIQDLLRVFVIRIACQSIESAVLLLSPVLSWISTHTKEINNQSEIDLFKIHRLLEFVCRLLEHPYGKDLLLKMGIMDILDQILLQSHEALVFLEDPGYEKRTGRQSSRNILDFCISSFKSLALIFDSRESAMDPCISDKIFIESINVACCSRIIRIVLSMCKALPVGRELLGCLLCLKEFVTTVKGRNAFLSIHFPNELPEAGEPIEQDVDINIPDISSWRDSPPFLVCWRKLLDVLRRKDIDLDYAVQSVHLLSLSCLCVCEDSGNLGSAISILRSLFGLSLDKDESGSSVDSLEDLRRITSAFDQKTTDDESVLSSSTLRVWHQAKEAVNALTLLLQNYKPSSLKAEGLVSPGLTDTSNYYELLLRSNEEEDMSLDSAFAERFVWECPDVAPDRLMMSSLPAKRKLTSAEGSVRRPRDVSAPEILSSNGFPRGLGPVSSSSGPTRRDTFRQRKPNTSRPPSMHVDDYVARERNADVQGVSTQRGGISTGRPPSIHVDEFMARQREQRQSSSPATTADVALGRNPLLVAEIDSQKEDRLQELKPDLDDDNEINIVFDDEPESDDKMLFPQPDDSLLAAPVAMRASSPSSTAEENESERNMSSSDDVHLSRRNSAQRDQNTSGNALPHFFGISHSQSQVEAQLSRAGFYHRDRPQKGGSGLSSVMSNQPPLPHTPPPTMSSIAIQSAQSGQSYGSGKDGQPPLPSGFPLQGYEVNAQGSLSGPNFQAFSEKLASQSATNKLNIDIYASSSSARSLPPPSTPLPPYSSPLPSTFSSHPAQLPLTSTPGIFPASGSALSTHSLPPFTPWPTPLSGSLFTSLNLQPSQSPPPPGQPSSQPRLPGPPPPPPPLVPRPSHPQQQPRVQFSQLPSDQVASLRSPVQSSSLEQHLPENTPSQQDPGLSLQQYFSSPEAIESLLNDRDKLCQILEQHPKLVQMLQERLGQL
ncbi:mRNA methyltransferase EMB2016 isoform X2 [Wolffia australiana]